MEASAPDQGKADELYIRAGMRLLEQRNKFPATSGNWNAARPGWRPHQQRNDCQLNGRT